MNVSLVEVAQGDAPEGATDRLAAGADEDHFDGFGHAIADRGEVALLAFGHLHPTQHGAVATAEQDDPGS